jgi:hypothetical protein
LFNVFPEGPEGKKGLAGKGFPMKLPRTCFVSLLSTGRFLR